jgi:hypothetical protein
LAILLDVAANPATRPGDVRKRIDKPWMTVRREMEALHILGILKCDEEETDAGDDDKKEKRIWRYSLSANFDCTTLLTMAGRDPKPKPLNVYQLIGRRELARSGRR